MEESKCPFCDQLLIEGDKDAVSCCNVPDIEHNNGIKVCINCGLVHGYDYFTGYIDFYANMYKIYKKSIYHREYHIQNVLNRICYMNRVELTHYQRDRIYKVFVEIGTILPLVNKSRKRMISVKFIMRRIFKMMGLPYKNIPSSKSKKTLAFYDKYWNSIESIIGDKINSIIRE